MEEKELIAEKKTKYYTEAQKRATKKYRDNNREKVNEQRKKYYNNRKEKDPEFLKYKREKAKYYYAKKKLINKIIDTPVCDEEKEQKEILLNNIINTLEANEMKYAEQKTDAVEEFKELDKPELKRDTNEPTPKKVFKSRQYFEREILK